MLQIQFKRKDKGVETELTVDGWNKRDVDGGFCVETNVLLKKEQDCFDTMTANNQDFVVDDCEEVARMSCDEIFGACYRTRFKKKVV
jgi:hypothetical protein